MVKVWAMQEKNGCCTFKLQDSSRSLYFYGKFVAQPPDCFQIPGVFGIFFYLVSEMTYVKLLVGCALGYEGEELKEFMNREINDEFVYRD